jgi:hypothetical protein
VAAFQTSDARGTVFGNKADSLTAFLMIRMILLMNPT